MDNKKVSIIIPTCTASHFLACKASVMKNTDPAQAEIIAVANGYDGSRQDFDGCELIWFDERIGYTKATNEGIKRARGEYIVLLNDDAIILDWGVNTWINMLVEPFAKNPKAGITGCLKLTCPHTQRQFMIFFCACMRKTLFDELGLLDEEAFSPGGAEDVDFCIKAENAGYELVQVPDDTREPGPGFTITRFPIYHIGRGTISSGSGEWSDIIAKHNEILVQRYGDGQPKVSIIIPTCKKENFQPCLKSIIRNTNLDKVEIIVVANGYNGPKEDFDECKLIWLDERIGYTKAINIGIKQATGEFIILLNDDCEVLDWAGRHGWIDMLLQPFKDKGVGITGPVKLTDSGLKRDFLVFFCVCMRHSLFDELGLLDEVFNPGGGEDTDFCIKAENAGYELVQVPSQFKNFTGGTWVTNFPLYHAAEKTVYDIPDWAKVIDSHRDLLTQRYLTLPQGAFWEDDIAEYRKILEAVPDGGTYGELGVLYGRSMCSVADIIRRKKLRVIAVDTFAQTECEKTPEQKLMHIDYQKTFEDNVKKAGLKVEIHRGFTHDVVKEFPDGSFDLLFIDADHRYVSIRQDIDDWKPKMKKSGIMSGHDYGGSWEGVKRAVDETFPMIRVGGHIWSQQLGHHISVSLCTRGRYTTTLPLAMASLATQTRLPDYVYIYDDTPESEWVDLREIPVIKKILQTYQQKNIGCYIIYGYKKGQHFGDQEVNRKAKDLVFRYDDDCIADPNVIEELEKALTDDVGAVGCSVIDPSALVSGVATGKLINISSEPNMQWVRGQGEVEHLHSCFLYRAHVADFDLTLSPRSFRGETMFSHEILRKGYKLRVINNCTIWHYKNTQGGCRSVISEKETQDMYAQDEKKFRAWLQAIKQPIFYLDSGIGDHLVFRKLLDDLQIKEATIACCYPDVFVGTPYHIISLALAQEMGYDPAKYDIYTWMANRNWTKPIYLAYKEMYQL